MKVCHVIWDLGQGGAQRYLVDLLTQQRKVADLECLVLVLTGRDLLSEDIEALGYPLHYLHLKSGFDVAGLFRAFRYLRRERPALVHSHSSCVGLAAVLQALSIPVVYTEHGGCLVGNLKHDRLVYRYLHRPIRRLVAISEQMTKVMAAANPVLAPRIEVVHNGVDVPRIDGLRPADEADVPGEWLRAAHRVGIVGRLVPPKGVGWFLQAAKEIHARHPDAMFGVVGDGPMRLELEQMATALGIANRVCFFGYRSDVIRLVKTFDVFLMTSEYEPFGLVVAEAMACSVPVVAFNIDSAVGEILRDGVHGYLVDKKDPRLLAQRVVALLEDSARRQAFGAQGRSRIIEEFTIERNAQHIERIYRSCISEP